MSNSPSRSEPALDAHPLEKPLRLVLGLGIALVVLLPMARGSSEWLGWMPMWLVGMPAMAWWSLRRFPLPMRKGWVQESVASARRRRPGAQARRRAVPVRRRLPRAA